LHLFADPFVCPLCLSSFLFCPSSPTPFSRFFSLERDISGLQGREQRYVVVVVPVGYQPSVDFRAVRSEMGPFKPVRWNITGGHGPGSGKVPQKESMEFLQTRGQSHFVVETKLRAAGVRAVGCSSYRLWAWSWLREIVSTQRDEFSPDHSQSHFVVKINLDRSVLFSQGPVYTFRSRVPAKCTQNLARKVNFYRDLFSPKPPCH
jgi:hypothetical protein